MIGFGLARNANSIIGWAASCFAQSVNVSSPQRPALRTKPVRRINGRHRLSLLVGWMFFLFQIRSGLAVNLIFFRSILPSPPGSFKCDAGDKNPCENNDANQYQRAVRCPFVECFNHPYIIQHPGDKSSLFPASAPRQIRPKIDYFAKWVDSPTPTSLCTTSHPERFHRIPTISTDCRTIRIPNISKYI